MLSKGRSVGAHLLVLAVLGVGTDAFVHPSTCTGRIASGQGLGDSTTVTSIYPAVTQWQSCLSHEQRKNVVLNEGLSLLDQVITTSIFAAGVYVTILKADNKEVEESAAVVVADAAPAPTPAPAPAPAAVAVAVAVSAKSGSAADETSEKTGTDPIEQSSPTESVIEVQDTPKESGSKRRLASKVAKKLVMPWRSFDDL
mmetsp:Transcript_925/g.2663  ORF Transcript_925/g.2663 Transcript_925/m.2663 type:complete len:199 (-) Transcript_925:327-923(-)